MARIYKESRYVLQLLIGKSYVAQYDDVKISFYTKNPNNQVMVDNGITIKRNIAEVKIESTLFDNLEEGLISYIVYGTKDGIPFIEERQSNYFLKAPLDFKPTTCNLEDKSVTPSMGDRNNDGYIVVEEDEIYDGLSRVVIDPQTLYNEGVNEQKSKLEAINITENGTYTKEDGYNQIEVNVPPKINIQEAGIKFAHGEFTEVPEWADFNGVTNMTYMFSDCSNLQTIPQIDTSNVTNMYAMLSNCFNLQIISQIDTSNVIDMSLMFFQCASLQTIPLLNTSNVENMMYMFRNCSYLQTIPQLNTSNVKDMSLMFTDCASLQTIPLLNTSNVENMKEMFSSCYSLQTIPSLDTSKVTNMFNMFENCGSLVSLPALNAQSLNMSSYTGIFGNNELSKLTDFGGFLNLKCSLIGNNNLKKLPNLTYESCINVLNGLYDFTGNGETPNSDQGKLKVHQNFLTTVGDEISIGTSKGWTITV